MWKAAANNRNNRLRALLSLILHREDSSRQAAGIWRFLLAMMSGCSSWAICRGWSERGVGLRGYQSAEVFRVGAAHDELRRIVLKPYKPKGPLDGRMSKVT